MLGREHGKFQFFDYEEKIRRMLKRLRNVLEMSEMSVNVRVSL